MTWQWSLMTSLSRNQPRFSSVWQKTRSGCKGRWIFVGNASLFVATFCINVSICCIAHNRFHCVASVATKTAQAVWSEKAAALSAQVLTDMAGKCKQQLSVTSSLVPWSLLVYSFIFFLWQTETRECLESSSKVTCQHEGKLWKTEPEKTCLIIIMPSGGAPWRRRAISSMPMWHHAVFGVRSDSSASAPPPTTHRQPHWHTQQPALDPASCILHRYQWAAVAGVPLPDPPASPKQKRT